MQEYASKTGWKMIVTMTYEVLLKVRNKLDIQLPSSLELCCTFDNRPTYKCCFKVVNVTLFSTSVGLHEIVFLLLKDWTGWNLPWITHFSTQRVPWGNIKCLKFWKTRKLSHTTISLSEIEGGNRLSSKMLADPCCFV